MGIRRRASLRPSQRKAPAGGLVLRRPTVALALIATLAGAGVALAFLLDHGAPDSVPTGTASASIHTAPATGAPAEDDMPGRGAPGIHVQVSPGPDGTLDVIEQVRFLGASTGLQIALPAVIGVVGNVQPKGATIAGLEVFADGHLLPQQAGSLATGGRLLLPNAPLRVELRYRLVGAAVRSTPSHPGRALVLLPPITSDDSLSKLPEVVEISGPRVRNLVCPALPPTDQLCGRRTSTGWRTVPLPSRATAVLAQLDLSPS